jgi:hypothetical protein
MMLTFWLFLTLFGSIAREIPLFWRHFGREKRVAIDTGAREPGIKETRAQGNKGKVGNCAGACVKGVVAAMARWRFCQLVSRIAKSGKIHCNSIEDFFRLF